MKIMSNYAPLVLRVGIGFVFIWFGYSGLTEPQIWTSLVPAWTSFLGSPTTLVLIHGAVELIGGLLLCAGWKIKIVSGILLLSLLQTLTILSFGPVMVRDIGLSMALFSIFLAGDEVKV